MRALEEECEDGKRLGFNGKQLIHPSQLEVAHRVFAPAREEVEWAVRCEIANVKAEGKGKGAWTLEGKMIDKPVVGKANAIVERAGLCGYDVVGLREKYKDVEPE